MICESYTAVVERNVWCGDGHPTEPYEAGWAREAIIFVRVLDLQGDLADASARVQISADGIHWIDEGSAFPVPQRADEVGAARLQNFGNWLRVILSMPGGGEIKALVTIALKS